MKCKVMFTIGTMLAFLYAIVSIGIPDTGAAYESAVLFDSIYCFLLELALCIDVEKCLNKNVFLKAIFE